MVERCNERYNDAKALKNVEISALPMAVRRFLRNFALQIITEEA